MLYYVQFFVLLFLYIYNLLHVTDDIVFLKTEKSNKYSKKRKKKEKETPL